MICVFYVQSGEGDPLRVGPITVRDEHEARRLAASRLAQDQAAFAVDVWAESGELFRVTPVAGEETAPIPFRPKRSSLSRPKLRLV